ncbi:MAG: GNAT family N-acetyltransferase [Alphaproteobacteria bacterium]|nr:GNAT family N-acetyltransferase [Alphaproteobacteria bacterium]
MPTTAPDPSGAQPSLTGDRLRLRPLTEADLPAMAELANDRELAERTARIPHPYGLEDARGFFKMQQRGGESVFAIERSADRSFLGLIGLVFPNGELPPSLGFWLGRPYWNQGYMTEAIGLVLDYAFTQLDAASVRAEAFLDNAASIRVQEKAGMTYIGRDVQAAPARGGDRDVEVREIRREAWRP